MTFHNLQEPVSESTLLRDAAVWDPLITVEFVGMADSKVNVLLDTMTWPPRGFGGPRKTNLKPWPLRERFLF